MFLSTLIAQMHIHAIKPFLKANIHCSKLEVRHFQSYGQWVKVIGAGVSYLVEGLRMTVLKLPSAIDSSGKPW